jgi:hypothetical protein
MHPNVKPIPNFINFGIIKSSSKNSIFMVLFNSYVWKNSVCVEIHEDVYTKGIYELQAW